MEDILINLEEGILEGRKVKIPGKVNLEEIPYKILIFLCQKSIAGDEEEFHSVAEIGREVYSDKLFQPRMLAKAVHQHVVSLRNDTLRGNRRKAAILNDPAVIENAYGKGYRIQPGIEVKLIGAEDETPIDIEEVKKVFRLMKYDIGDASLPSVLFTVTHKDPLGIKHEHYVNLSYKPLGSVTDQEKLNFYNSFKNKKDIESGIIVTPKGSHESNWGEEQGKSKVYLFPYPLLLSRIIDFPPYLDYLISDYNSEYNKELTTYYIDLYGYESDDSPIQQIEASFLDGGKNGKKFSLDEYVKKWLGDNNETGNLCILGGPGTGKTCFTRKLACDLAKEYQENPIQNRLPILIEWREYAESKNPQAMIVDLLKNKASIQTDLKSLNNLMNVGKLVLIIDGFDETPVDVDVRVNFQNLAQLCRSNNKVIITGRQQYFPSHEEAVNILLQEDRVHGPKYEVVYIAPFSRQQIEEFLTKQGLDVGKMMSLIRDYNLFDLSQCPLLLDMIADALPHISGEEKRINKAGLYDEYIRRCLRPGLMKTEDKKLVLQEFALNMKQGDTLSINNVARSQIIEGYFPQKTRGERNSLDAEILACTLLKRDSEVNCSFVHKSFQEFFVAQRIYEEASKGEAKEIRLSVEEAQFLDDFLRLKGEDELCKLLNSEDRNIRGRAALVLGEIEDEDKKVVEPLITRLKVEKDSDVRKNVAQALGTIGHPKAVDSLMDVLKDSAALIVRECAARALGKIGNQKAFELLMNIFQEKDETSLLRRTAAQALGEIGNDEAINPLVNILQDGAENAHIRQTAAWALGQIDSGVEKLFASDLREHEDFQVREWVDWALGNINTRRISVPIQVLQDKEKYSPTRRAAAVWKLKETNSVAKEKALKDLIATLEETDEEVLVHYYAARALGAIDQIPIEEIVKSLMKIFKDDTQNPIVRGAAAQALGRRYSLLPVDSLRAALENKEDNLHVRNCAAGALGTIGEKIAFKSLGDLFRSLKDVLQQEDNSIFRRTIAWAVGKIGSKEARENWEEAARYDKSCEEVIEDVMEGLQEGVECLIFVLLNKEEPFEVRDGAAWALGRIGNEEAFEPLKDILQKKDEEEYRLRKTAAWSLGKLDRADAVGVLMEVLHDKAENLYVRDCATWALGQTRNENAVDGLIDALDDEEILIMRTSAFALGEIGSPKALPRLYQLKEDTREDLIWDDEKFESRIGTVAEVADEAIKKIDKKRGGI